MDKIVYTQEKMDAVKTQVQKLVEIVAELEAEFPGRHFTLDGHLVGSIGVHIITESNYIEHLLKFTMGKLKDERYRLKFHSRMIL